MKSYECAIFILFRKHTACIKEQSVGRKMTGKCIHRILCVFSAGFLSISTIFRTNYFFLLDLVVVNVRPAAIRAFMQFIHTFSRQLGALFVIIITGIQAMEIITAMLYNKQCIGRIIPV